MNRDQTLTEDLVEYSKKINLDIIGFAHPKHFDRYKERNQPETYLKNSNTIIVAGMHLFDINLDAYCHDKSKGIDYHFADSIIELKCHLIKDWLNERNLKSVILTYYPGLFLKEAAALAGIGPIGKNNLLLTKKFGPQVRLRAISTEAALICGKPITESEYCKECDLCIQACPADAFPNGKYNKRKCQKYQYANLKYLSDDTTIWCNECIEACPLYKNRDV